MKYKKALKKLGKAKIVTGYYKISTGKVKFH